MLSRKVVLAALLIAALLAAACDEASDYNASLQPQVYAIDPTFREFYDLLGGEDLLGPGISPLFTYQNVDYQYTVAVLMVRDPGAPAYQRFTLGPLGLDMGLREAPALSLDQPDKRYIQGRLVYDLFVPLYEKLGGLRYTGEPLTEVHYNPEKARYEQFFANLGFYWREGDPRDSVHLLAYGAWKCDAKCRSPQSEASTVVLPFRTSKRFASSVERLGADFTGYAITDEHETPDGYIEQVFENVVLVVDPSQPGRISLRAVTERLGYRPDPLQSRKGNSQDYFYEIQGGRGYIVPRRFFEYLNQRSGFELSGPPIGEIARVKDAVYQQCFTNLCLQAFLDALGNITVRPAPLGYTYRLLPVQELNQPVGEPVAQPDAEEPTIEAEPETSGQPQPEAQLPAEAQPGSEEQPEVEAYPPAEEQPESVEQPEAEVQPPAEVEIQPQVPPSAPSGPVIVQVWESFPMVAPRQSQEIGVSVFQDGQPVPNVEPDLTVSLLDGSQKTYYMLPTGSDGQSRMNLDPIIADSGTLVPYKVCIYNLGGETLCVQDSFLIWVSP